MKPIFAPWRMAYLGQGAVVGCIFCDFPAQGVSDRTLVVLVGRQAFVMLNRFPYTSGHLMVVPFRHVATPVDLLPEDWAEMGELVQRSIRALESTYHPQGFNVGINVGRAAGAGIEDHCHMHVVPRWSGDNNFVPVLAETRVIPEALEVTHLRLVEAFVKQDAGEEVRR
jgi:ATP adenylyltransferase